MPASSLNPLAAASFAGHYENFPVASLLLPRRTRAAVAAIYWFARSADDIADEGRAPAAQRLAALDGYRARLAAIEAGAPLDDPRWRNLAAHVGAHALPLRPFYDLLSAFAQDVTTTRYSTFAELADYCRRSANPVGRLLLHLFDATSERALALSDRICTALQLLNFCQDAALDWRIGRIYFPLDELQAHGVGEEHFAAQRVDDAWRALFDAQLARALCLLKAGSELPAMLRGRARLELRAIVAGGERIGARLASTRGDVFRRRPQLNALDWLAIGLRAAGARGRGTPAAAPPESPG